MNKNNGIPKYTTVYRSIPVMILAIFLITLVSAEVQSLGTFKQNSAVNLVQSCGNSTYSNVTQVLYPDAAFALNGNYAMTKSGNNYNYTFTSTHKTGQYIVYGNCDENTVNTPWVYDFNVTPSGDSNSLIGFFFLVIILVYGLVVLGIWKQDIPLTLLGTIGLYIVGLFMFQYGIDVYKNWMTNAISIVTLGVAAYVSIRMAMEFMGE